MSVPYDAEFFANQAGALRSARRMLPIVLELIRPQTLVDVGCGIGVWTKVAKELGCSVMGFDGNWVPRERLLIAPDEFHVVDLEHPPQATRQFDLAVSLEVAEHLPAAAADEFVGFLTSLAPCVLFSGAVPLQRGTGHINEQYPSYWIERFSKCHFDVFDVVRPQCWRDGEIEFYYRQNVLIFAEHGRTDGLEAARVALRAAHPLDIVHPDAVPILAQGWMDSAGTMKCLGFLQRAVRRSIRKRLAPTKT